MASDCVFCSLPGDRLLLDAPSSFAVYDAFPVSPGHALVIPKRHVPSLWDLDEEETTDLLAALRETRAIVTRDHGPAGFNVGVNDGKAAGQTVMHLHIHLIPRYAGDRDDPRGGVRWLFPDKAAYWE